MGVTFNLPQEFRKVTREDWVAALTAVCPECGGHERYAPVEQRRNPDVDCERCHGDGGDTDAMDAYYVRVSEEDGEFDVANGNASYLVQDLLNLPCSEVSWGSLDPATILLRLSLVFDTSKGVVEPSEEQAVLLSEQGVSLGCKVYNAGRTERQCDSYVQRLKRLAELAIERGAPEVVWG